MRAYERLLKYVKVWTTSDPESGTHPSTMRQFDLAHQLVQELKDLGLTDAHVDEHCYVYATLPATPGQESAKPLGFIAHMDTTDDASGENVNPQIHPNYDGGKVVLPATGTVLDPAQFPFLTEMKGQTLITTDGATLSYMGLPCPNLGTGGFNFHGPCECITAEKMDQCTEILLNLVDLYK